MNTICDNANIVEEARREVEREQLINDIPHMEQIVYMFTIDASSVEMSNYMQRILAELNYLNTHSEIAYYRPIHSHRKVIGSLILFIRRIIRRLNRFLVETIVTDQSEFNSHLASALGLVLQELARKDEQIKELRSALQNERGQE